MHIKFLPVIAIIALSLVGCNAESDLSSGGGFGLSAAKSGRLITQSGIKFPYKWSPASGEAVSVIYIGGMGGGGNEISALSGKFNAAGLSLMTFNRKDKGGGLKGVQARSQNGKAVNVTTDGKLSAAQVIVNDEINSAISFVKSSASYSPTKGIVLIGGSYGSWLNLNAISDIHGADIKGAVFMSPMFPPSLFTSPDAKPENVENLERLAAAFGDRPSIAFANVKDASGAPHFFNSMQTAQLLNEKLQTKIIDPGTSLHSAKLLLGRSEVADQTIEWIASNF